MAENSGGEKTEKASPHKRMEARKKGNVFQSKDLVSGVTILLGFLALRQLGGFIFVLFEEAFRKFISAPSAINEVTPEQMAITGADALRYIFFAALPLLLVAMLLGIISSIAQTRLIFTASALKPKFSRLNPIEGFKKMFSMKSLVELLKAIAKVTVIILVVYNAISGKMRELPLLPAADVFAVTTWLCSSIIDIALQAGFAMLAIGIVDYFYQWWDYERTLMMSKQEVKDEYKQLEGNPEIKSRVKSIQRQMATQRMMSQVKNADVVVRNPEHFAVAVKYTLHGDKGPVVVAKGVDFLARRIVEEAGKYKIEMVENPPLARALYDAVELNEEIPEQYWDAVSQIIYLVYQKKNKLYLLERLA